MIVEDRRKRRSGCFTFFLGFIIFFAVILVGFLITFFIIRGNYLRWEKETFAGRLETDYTYISGEIGDILEVRVQSKIAEYATSTELVDYVEFTTHESAYIFGKEISDSLPDGFVLDKLYLQSSRGVWNLYCKPSFIGIELPWTMLRIEKDDIETAQVFVSVIEVGGENIEQYGFKRIRDDINSGLQDALVLISGNDFTGRSFDNIELESDGMIVKGRINQIRN